MTNPLPPIISRYFTAADDGDIDALVGCFSPDAVVIDEGVSRCGYAEIRQWREDVAGAYDYTLEVPGTEPAGGQGGLDWPDVPTQLEGNSPCGSGELTYHRGRL